MLFLAAISPGLGLRPPTGPPHTLAPQTDLLATLAVLLIGLFLVAATIRSTLKR